MCLISHYRRTKKCEKIIGHISGSWQAPRIFINSFLPAKPSKKENNNKPYLIANVANNSFINEIKKNQHNLDIIGYQQFSYQK